MQSLFIGWPRKAQGLNLQRAPKDVEQFWWTLVTQFIIAVNCAMKLTVVVLNT